MDYTSLIDGEIKRAIEKFKEMSSESQEEMLASHRKDVDRLYKTYDRAVSGRNPWKSTLHLVAFVSAKSFYESLLLSSKNFLASKKTSSYEFGWADSNKNVNP